MLQIKDTIENTSICKGYALKSQIYYTSTFYPHNLSVKDKIPIQTCPLFKDSTVVSSMYMAGTCSRVKLSYLIRFSFSCVTHAHNTPSPTLRYYTRTINERFTAHNYTLPTPGARHPLSLTLQRYNPLLRLFRDPHTSPCSPFPPRHERTRTPQVARRLSLRIVYSPLISSGERALSRRKLTAKLQPLH